jgi:hypothetical protein
VKQRQIQKWYLVADVDLKLLDELNSYGSVRNLKDRRLDFYELKKKVISMNEIIDKVFFQHENFILTIKLII